MGKMKIHFTGNRRTRVLPALLLPVIALTQVQCIPPEEPTGRRLREIVTDNDPEGSVFIGATEGSHSFTPWPTNRSLVMDREYSYVTPENDFKQSRIHPTPEM